MRHRFTPSVSPPPLFFFFHYGSKQRGKRRRFALEMSAVSNFVPSRYGGGRSVSFSGTATESKFRPNMALIPRPFEVLVSIITQNHSEFICFVSR